MNFKLKHSSIAFATALIMILSSLFSACSYKDGGTTDSSDTSHTTGEIHSYAPKATEESIISESPELTYVPYAYTLDYHRCSTILEQVVGKKVINAAYQVGDAFLAHKNSVKIDFGAHPSDFSSKLSYAMALLYPPFKALTTFHEIKSFNYDKGTVSWEFTVDDNEFDNMLVSFENKINDYISVLCKDDSETMRAMLLYNALTEGATYDYDVINADVSTEEFDQRTSVYGALMNKTGICNSFSYALTFIYTQVGINSIPVSSFETAAHSWTLLKLDDKCYYCDPTWDIGGGFAYFGITASDRASWAGEYPEDSCKIYTTLVSDFFTVDDSRFENMREFNLQAPITIQTDRANDTLNLINGETICKVNCK